MQNSEENNVLQPHVPINHFQQSTSYCICIPLLDYFKADLRLYNILYLNINMSLSDNQDSSF